MSINDNSKAQAVFGGGCFWCTEAVFDALKGVEKVEPGYAGGKASTANYESVSSGATQHAEVIRITYDPSEITYAELLEVFFSTHDPTTLNRQGNDRGPQYRSVIFYNNEEERQTAQEAITGIASSLYSDPVVTELSPLTEFYLAEEYHHNYYEKVGARNPYCTMVISPKVSKLRKKFSHRLK